MVADADKLDQYFLDEENNSCDKNSPKTLLYFLVSELITPAKKPKMLGIILATSFIAQSVSHTASIQVKNQTTLTPPIFGSFLVSSDTCVAPAVTGMARTRATGRMYIE